MSIYTEAEKVIKKKLNMSKTKSQRSGFKILHVAFM